MSDPYHLQRFVAAQDPVCPAVLKELRDGHKRTHWMWFFFPQLAGLGHSHMARHFAIASVAEALAYLAHPTLGPRLRTCTELVLQVEGRSVDQIFGSPDNLKFHSSMTLFARVAPDEPAFTAALRKYFNGELDKWTMTLLGPNANPR